MPRAPKIPAEVRELVARLIKSGRPYPVIQAEVKEATGYDVSAGWISGQRKEPPPPRPAAPPAVAHTALGIAVPAQADPPPPAPPSSPGEPADILATLSEVVDALKTLSLKARDDENVAGYTSLTRVLNQTVALLAKFQPAPVANPDEHPDMVAAAARARAKLHELLSKAQRGTL